MEYLITWTEHTPVPKIRHELSKKCSEAEKDKLLRKLHDSTITSNISLWRVVKLDLKKIEN